MTRFTQGSAEQFDQSWRDRQETLYLHWTQGRVQNQIQFAFRQHWSLFKELLPPSPPGTKCLEVGCGRGSISAYFADHGYDCTLFDISEEVIGVAKHNFSRAGLAATYSVGDALSLPFGDQSFDVVVSIGLLEHFVEIEKCLSEQVRALSAGGVLLAYIVPSIPENVQRHWSWLNKILSLANRTYSIVTRRQSASLAKPDLYRSDDLSERYTRILEDLPVHDIASSGVYPLPMISHSIEFPFTVMPRPFEWLIVRIFDQVMKHRRKRLGHHPWLCREGQGQAILVWCRKLSTDSSETQVTTRREPRSSVTNPPTTDASIPHEPAERAQ